MREDLFMDELPVILAGLEGEGYDVSHMTGGKLRRSARHARNLGPDPVAIGRRLISPDYLVWDLHIGALSLYRIYGTGRGQWLPRLLHRNDPRTFSVTR
jgi:hypothetical protein